MIMIKAIIFDLDGVLCSLVNVHRVSFNDALIEVSNYEIKDYEFWKYYNGLPSKTKLSMLINRGIVKPGDVQQIWNIKQELTFKRIEELLKPDYEKIELHKYLKSKGYKIACVSNSIRKTIDLALEATKQLEFMDLILSNEDFGDKPKPNSYCYEQCIKKLMITKKEALIIEDSEKGIMAARGSGANVMEVNDATEVTILNLRNNIEKVDKKCLE